MGAGRRTVSQRGGWVDLHPLIRALPSFCFGAALYYNKEVVAGLPAPRPVFVVSMIATALMMGFGAPQLATLAVAYVVVASAVATDLSVNPGTFVRHYGPYCELTYSIYMGHSIVILVLMSAFGDKLLRAGPPLMLVLGVVCYAVIALLSWLSYFTLEKPARRWIDSFKMFRRRTAVAQ